MVVQVPSHDRRVEVVQSLGVGPHGVPVDEHLADHAAVLALRQAIVAAAPRVRLGDLCHAQPLQRRGQLEGCVLGTVLRMEALHGKREEASRRSGMGSRKFSQMRSTQPVNW